MAIHDNPDLDTDYAEGLETDLAESIKANHRLNEELSFLFGTDIVEQANQIDITDLNLNKDIIDCISTGVRRLKELKNNPKAQLELVNTMEPGARIVLCLWISDMDLLGKIQDFSYLNQQK